MAGSNSASRGEPNSLKKAPITMFSLWRERSLLAQRDEPLDDEADDEHLERQEGEVLQKVEEHVAAVAEDGELDRVEDDRDHHQPRGEQPQPAAVAAFHRAISTGTLA